MAEPSCPRCGAAVAAAARRCVVCGVALPEQAIAPITVAPEAEAGRRARLSQAPTIPDAVMADRRNARPRRLSPPAAAEGVDYSLQGVLGAGGMGVVWSAVQAGLGREVAVKRIRPGASRRAAEQLLAEAELTGSLEHPGIVPVYDVGVDQDGVPFYSMRRLRGRTWAERWPRLSQREHLDVLLRVCDAVAYAHGQGVVHRDLKPGNVFLGEYGEVVVFDWGLAARIADLRAAGRKLMASGTPAYMAPEMARADGQRIGPASDIYLLGAILYEVLTGHPPHDGVETVEVLLAAADNRFDPPIPEGELGDVARRAMAADPRDRYADVRAMQAALRTYLEHQESVALAARAEARMAAARSAEGYDGFARAVHAFEDAIEMWPGNQAAVRGLSLARLEFSRRAREAGDLDLASRLLTHDDPTHASERIRIAVCQAERQRRRTALRVLAWSTGALMVALLFALATGLMLVSRQRDRVLAIARERDAAEAALAHEQRSEAESLQRMWRRVVQEDFSGTRLPANARVVAGRWGLTEAQLVAEGEGDAVLVLAVPGPGGLVLQIDIEPGGRVEVAIAGTVVGVEGSVAVTRDGRSLAAAALPDTVAGLGRRLRIERDGGRLRVFADGRELVRVPVDDGPVHELTLTARPGTVLDNLKLEVPWE